MCKKIIAIIFACICAFSATINCFAANGSICTVEYNNAEGFVFSPSSCDLFQNFKNVMPGDTLSQDIIVKNTCAKNNISVFLRAEIEQQYYDLLKYIKIQVTNISKENGKTKTDIVAESVASERNLMAQDVLLGVYEPNETSTIRIILDVDKQMGNQYKLTEGIINWIFTVEEGGEEGSKKYILFGDEEKTTRNSSWTKGDNTDSDDNTEKHTRKKGSGDKEGDITSDLDINTGSKIGIAIAFGSLLIIGSISAVMAGKKKDEEDKK